MSERVQDAVDSADADSTVVLPTPGRRRGQYAYASYLDRHAAAANLAALGGLNALIQAANPILAAVPQIRHALRHPDAAGLRAKLREQIEAFERSARDAQIAEDRLLVARYALCALLDDSASATPWGRDWATHGLLADVHGEASGAEKFFAQLDQMSAAPAAHLELLEFFYVCLALGFEGRYRGGEGARQALAQARARLYELIGALRPQASTALSGRWRGAEIRPRRVSGALALWGAASGCVLVLAGLYFAYSVSLGALSDPVARDLARLKAPPLAAAVAVPAISSRKKEAGLSLGQQLSEAIGRREVEVVDVGGAAVIVLKADQLFASGSARLDAGVRPLIMRIAETLERIPGAIVITGHTDDVPIRSARFPSNWELSAERARSVSALMATRLREPGRLRAEGVADSEPLAANDGSTGRARNRRVAIILRTAP